MIRFGGRREFVGKLLSSNRASLEGHIVRLREATKRKDWEQVCFVAHVLKGLGGNLEISALYALARETEVVARECGNKASRLAGELSELVSQVLKEMSDDSGG